MNVCNVLFGFKLRYSHNFFSQFLNVLIFIFIVLTTCWWLSLFLSACFLLKKYFLTDLLYINDWLFILFFLVLIIIINFSTFFFLTFYWLTHLKFSICLLLLVLLIFIYFNTSKDSCIPIFFLSITIIRIFLILIFVFWRGILFV